METFNDLDNKDNYPISLFRNWKSQIRKTAQRMTGLIPIEAPNCETQSPDPISRLKEFFKSPIKQTIPEALPKAVLEPKVDQIDGACVSSVIRQTNFTPVAGANHYVCKSQNSEKPLPEEKTPCVTEEMSDYATWLTNQALLCLSEDDPALDATTIFKMMNNESRFSFLVHYGGGTGITQLTRPGAYGEMERDLGGERFLKSKLQSGRKSCLPFAPLLNDEPRDFPCSVLQPGAGVARAIFYGVGYFAYLKYPPKGKNVPSRVLRMRAVSRIGQYPVNQDPDQDSRNKLINDVVLVAYSNAGPAVAYSKLTESLQNLGCNRSNPKCTAKALRTDYRVRMSRYYRTVPMGASEPIGKNEKNPAPRPNYLREIEKRAASLDRDVKSCVIAAEKYSTFVTQQEINRLYSGGMK